LFSAGKFWLGLGLSVVLVALFFMTVDVGHMADALARANYLYVAPAVALYMIGVVFRTMRWQVLLRHIKPVSNRRLFPVVVIGYMANNLLPMRLGEVVRSYYLGEREQISKSSALATIFIERIFDALTLLLFVAVVALFVPVSGVAAGFGEQWGVAPILLAAGLSLPFVAAFGVMLLLSRWPERTRNLAIMMMKPLPQRFPHERALHIVEYFLAGFASLASPRKIALLFALSVPVWGFETGLFYLIGFSFGFHLVYDNLWHLAAAMALVTALANIGSSIPSSPGGIGLFELIARETLVLLPLAVVDRSDAAAFAAVSHFALLLPMIILGQVFLWAGNLSLRRLAQADSAG